MFQYIYVMKSCRIIRWNTVPMEPNQIRPQLDFEVSPLAYNETWCETFTPHLLLTYWRDNVEIISISFCVRVNLLRNSWQVALIDSQTWTCFSRLPTFHTQTHSFIHAQKMHIILSYQLKLLLLEQSSF